MNLPFLFESNKKLCWEEACNKKGAVKTFRWLNVIVESAPERDRLRYLNIMMLKRLTPIE